MSTFAIDVGADWHAFSTALNASPAVINRELLTANQVIIAEGIALGQDNAPRLDGVLADSIQPIGAVTAAGGEFGTSVIYANQREYGGTIMGNPWLVFQVNGRWVKVRSVTQSGSFYMKRTFDELQPFAMIAWDRALERVWDAL